MTERRGRLCHSWLVRRFKRRSLVTSQLTKKLTQRVTCWPTQLLRVDTSCYTYTIHVKLSFFSSISLFWFTFKNRNEHITPLKYSTPQFQARFMIVNANQYCEIGVALHTLNYSIQDIIVLRICLHFECLMKPKLMQVNKWMRVSMYCACFSDDELFFRRSIIAIIIHFINSL